MVNSKGADSIREGDDFDGKRDEFDGNVDKIMSLIGNVTIWLQRLRV